jgi:hypothetical protein
MTLTFLSDKHEVLAITKFSEEGHNRPGVTFARVVMKRAEFSMLDRVLVTMATQRLSIDYTYG